MFQTGSQINPSLGRTDYSAYAQGAIAGGQAIGQGIANLGQGIASGIEQYTKQKKENKQLEAKLKGSIVALEGLGQIAKGVSPEANASYTGLMSKLNDPSISITEKVALSDAAQGTLKELISFGIEANTKRDAAAATNLGLASAQSGKPIPSIYSPEIMASASKQALEFSAQRAALKSARLNQAKTKAETNVIKTPPSSGFSTINEAQMIANNMAAAAGVGTKGKTRYDTKTNRFFPVVIEEQPPTLREPFEQLDVQNFEEFTKQTSSAIDAGKNAKNTLRILEDEKVEAGILARPYELFNRLASGFSEDSNERATLQTIARQGLTQNTLGSFRTFMGGLGALSNMEGERVERAVPSISDPKDSTRFALNVVILAGEESIKQRKLATDLRKQGKTPFEVNNAISDLREKTDVTRAAWQKTFGNKPYVGDPVQPSPSESAANLRDKYGLTQPQQNP